MPNVKLITKGQGENTEYQLVYEKVPAHEFYRTLIESNKAIAHIGGYVSPLEMFILKIKYCLAIWRTL